MKIQAKKQYTILLLLIAVSIEVTGQYIKLGSHSRPSKSATVLAGKFPPPSVFYHHFVKLGQPLLMKNVLNETEFPAFDKWSDNYLRTTYGDEIVEIERGKKEDREGPGVQLRLSKFLEIYDQSDLYMVHTVPDSMKDEVMVPHSLQCGGFQNNLQDAVLWFSAGETKSVLHYDTVDNINCLLDGEKKLVLIDRKYKKMIEEHGWVEEGGYSLVDVDGVDPIEFQGVQHAPWYQINMEKGDCVFIPYKWYHHVYSPPGRNFAVNLWFSHLWWFNMTDCEDFTSKENEPLSKFSMASPNEQLRSEFVARFEGNDDMTLKTFKLNCGCTNEQDAEKLLEMVNKNKDRKVTKEELYSFDLDEVVQKVPECFNIDETDDEVDAPDAEDGERKTETVIDKSKERTGDNDEINDEAVDIDRVQSESLERRVEDNNEPVDKIDEEISDKDLFTDKTVRKETESVRLDESSETVTSASDIKHDNAESEGKNNVENAQNTRQQKQKHSKHDEF